MPAMSDLTNLPDRISAGTTVTYTRTLADYPASAGWTLTLYLAGPKVLKAEAAASGDDHVVLLTAAQTATLEQGTYRWVERVTKAAEAYDVASGTIGVDPDLADAADGELQLSDEKLLALLDAAISGQVTDGIASYQIGGRAVSKIPLTELTAMRNSLRNAVAAAQGGRPSRKVLFTFPPAGYTQ